MIVLDASAAIEWFLQTPAGQRIADRIFARSESLHAPHLLDLEVTQAIWKLALQKTISEERAAETVRDLPNLRIDRYPHAALLPRIWQLRGNLSAYDAAYVVLAENLGAALITCDARLAAASGHSAKIEVF